MSMTSENEERISKNWSDSPLFEEINSGGNVEGYGQLKKGPWTVAEDEILVEYVTKHGEGNWNSVKKYSGLMRCGKSCRLRWSNHLRPDLKKGAFTPEEECLIIKLHAEMGNKWARMAAELPGRTDNEIKNYWNTRIKRKQRAGLPIYPPDICLQPSNQSQQTDDMNTFSTGNVHINPDFLPDIPSFNSKIFGLNQPLYPPTHLDNHANVPRSNLSSQSIHSSYPITMHPPKRPRRPDSMFPSFPTGNQYQVDDGQQFILSSAYDASFSNVFMGSHAILNGNPSSASEPSWAMKMELPSLQTQMGGSSGSSWGSPSSPLPNLESFDILAHTPPTEHKEPYTLSSRNCGLLEAVLCDAKNMHDSKWEAAYNETRSPLVQSPSPVFTEGTPYLDEPGFQVQETNNLISETPKNTIFPRPDFWHSSNGFGIKDSNRDHLLIHDAIGSLFDEQGL